jgi:hypothetical protein
MMFWSEVCMFYILDKSVQFLYELMKLDKFVM